MNWLQQLINWINGYKKPQPQPIPVPVPLPQPIPVTPTIQELKQRFLDAHNKYRAQHNLAPLKFRQELDDSAQEWSDEMYKEDRMYHSLLTFSRFNKHGYNYSNAGENIAWNYNTPEDVVAAWMNDIGHRSNVLGNYKDIGFGISGKYYCCDYGTSF